MYIGMRGHDFDTNTLDALCEKCKEYGVGGVQLVLLRSLADFKKGNFTPEYAKSIGDKLRENGIRVPILGCYINPSDANEESLNESLDYFIENCIMQNISVRKWSVLKLAVSVMTMK